MFSNKEAKKTSQTETIIGAETVIEGKLTIGTSVRIDGHVYGEIDCKGDVTIGDNGYAEEKITARNLNIAGTVKGQLFVNEKIHIHPTGKLIGHAEMASIVMEEGAYFQGESKMERDDAPQPAPSHTSHTQNDDENE